VTRAKAEQAPIIILPSKALAGKGTLVGKRAKAVYQIEKSNLNQKLEEGGLKDWFDGSSNAWGVGRVTRLWKGETKGNRSFVRCDS